MRLMLGIVIFLITAARAAAVEPVASVPYRIDYDGWYTIDVNVNGQGPYHFIIDTGATLTAVFESITASQPLFDAVGPDLRILGLSGAQYLPPVTIGDIDIGGLEFTDHVGVVIPDWDGVENMPHGVLGLDFLSAYTVYFNAPAGRIEFYAPDNPPTDKLTDMGRTRLELNRFTRRNDGLYAVTATIDRRRIPFILDLGAAGTIINYNAMRRLLGGIYIDAPRGSAASTGSKIRDIFGDQSIARSIRITSIRMGGARWGRRILVVYNAGIFNELGLYSRPYGLMGADMFRDRSFILDFAGERLYLSGPVIESS